MKQKYSYIVDRLSLGDSTILNEKDRNLIQSYHLGIQSFNPDESRLDVNVLDVDDTVLETYKDTSDYSVRGVMQGPTKVNELEVDPTLYFEFRTFPHESIIVEYKAFNNVYGKGAEFYLAEISADRTEIRLKSNTISPRDLQNYSNLLQNRFNNSSYFAEAFVEFEDIQVPVINVLVETSESGLVATFKLYEPLPEEIGIKDVCQVLESLGESARFKVTRKVTVIEEPVPELRGPNFAVEIGTTTVATDYRNYRELLSQKSWESSKGLYTAFKQAALHTSVDYTDFSDFIHFSSAVERLENARYKFESIFDLQFKIAERNGVAVEKYQKEIEGIIENFDHYENYLYFEYGPYAWPKKIDPETGLPYRPYIPEDDVLEYEKWYEEMYDRAEAYDLNNKDILISTVPEAIREDLDHNEPYLIFIHMIGQHFDDLWVYARAITDRYKGDNRPDFGISKELVKEAVEHFGIDLYESNQNLNALFELCQPDGTYDSGLENYVNKFRSVQCPYTRSNSTDESGSFITGSWEQSDEYELQPDITQPMLAESYTKEVYKRIYHNIPVLLKTRGTSRGLRVLLNCFGIPNDILTIKVQGGVNTGNRPFFGPDEQIVVSPQFESTHVADCRPNTDVAYSGSFDKIRLVDAGPILEYEQISDTGSFFTKDTLSRYTTVTGSSSQRLTDDLHKVEVGFDLNEAVNRFFRENVGDFTVDTVLGDPRNTLEQYGDPWRSLRESLLAGLDVDEKFRSPAAIIRLVRYFDTTLFRMLQDFIPARATISPGAIVKDNILHRNRWKGVDLSWQVIIESGSTTGSKVSGSHGGAYKPDYDTTTGSHIVSTGGSWVEKPVASGSREFTGELSGTELEVTDGELNSANPDKKAGQPRNRYGYNVWFLDLPDIPLCSVKTVDFPESQYWRVLLAGTQSAELEVTALSQSIALSTKPVGIFTSIVSGSGRLIVHSRWNSSSWEPDYNIPTFMGWDTDGTSSLVLTRSLGLSEYDEGSKYAWTASYNTASRKVLWFCVKNPYNPDPLYEPYYYKTDLLVTWKYLKENQNPETAATEDTSGSIWNNPSDVVLCFSDGAGFGAYRLPAVEMFGTSGSYKWLGLSSMSYNTFSGVRSVGEHAGPYIKDSYIVDAQWERNKGEWPTPSWEITVGYDILPGDRSESGQPWGEGTREE